MSDSIIRVSNLGKRYIIGHRNGRPEGLRHAIQEAATAPWRWLRQTTRPRDRETTSPAVSSPSSSSPPGVVSSPVVSSSRSSSEEFWALRDVSFEVKRGEVVGIIGRNGAGKSTLLKILSRITEPTTGRVELDGRVASLLEVGTGFHPELTGRENVFLNGAILGMSRAEIRKKFDEIVAFAEVEKFLDTPVKRYSSGMYVRLAFAVAAHLEPEILIVDEVLAVGDAQFQKKCLGKMQQVASNEGRTILFVSHNLEAVRSLCTSALLLRSGYSKPFSSVPDALKDYNIDNISSNKREWIQENKRVGTGDFRLVDLLIHSPSYMPEEVKRFTLVVEKRTNNLTTVSIRVTIRTLEGQKLLTCDSRLISYYVYSAADRNKYFTSFQLRSPSLKPGEYILDVAVIGSEGVGFLDVVESAITFNVIGKLPYPEANVHAVNSLLQILPDFSFESNQ